MVEQKELASRQLASRRKGFFLLILSILAFAGGGAYYAVHQILECEVVPLERQQESLFHVVQTLERKNLQLANSTLELQTALKALEARDFNLLWRVNLIEHLVATAGVTLQQGQPGLASSLLELALKYTREASLQPVQEALQRDIRLLKEAQAKTGGALLSHLAKLEKAVDVLQLFPLPSPSKSPQGTPINYQPNVGFWQRLFTNALAAGKNLVIIRYQQTPMPILSVEQENLVRMQLKTKLMQASLAIMQRDEVAYHLAISQGLALVERYAPVGCEAVSDFIKALNTVAEIKGVVPPIPELESALLLKHLPSVTRDKIHTVR